MTGRPEVSVVIPVHHGERLLAEALASVAAQTLAAFETIVVVDGASDRSAEIAEAAGARVYVQDHTGVAGARNTGCALARGGLLAFLDQDDVWHPRKLELQWAQLGDTPDHVAQCHLLAARTAGIERPSWLPESWESVPQPGYIPSTWLVNADVFGRVGGFDASLRMACDSDWLARARELGHGTVMLAEPLVRWRIHGENASYDQVTMGRERFAVLRRTAARQRLAVGDG